MTVIRHAQRQHSAKRVNAVNAPTILPSVVVPSDAYFKYTSLLLPGTGTNNATNNTFLDSSTNNFTITRNGNPTQGTFTPYGSNWSNYFDGTGDYLTIPYSTTAFDWWTTDYTLEAWVFASSWTGWSASTTQPALIGNFAEAGTTNYWCFGPHSDGTVKFNYWNGSTSNYATSSATVVLNQWNHIAFTKTSSGIIVWVNGVGNTVTAISGTPQSATAQPLTIGKTTTSAGITGYVSNIRIVKGTAVYTSNFTPPTAPLTAIANTSLLTCADNRLIDDSTNNFTITKNGDVSVQRFSPFSPAQAYSAGTIGGSGYFDGTGDYLTTPADAAFTFGTGNLTLECWIYQTATSASTYRVIFADNVYGNAGGYTLYSYNNALNLWKGGSGGIEVIAPAGTIALNTWTHVAWTRSGSSNRLFINGIQVGATTTDATNYTSTASYIGASQTGTLPFIGYISDVRIVKGTAVYTTNFTPSTTPLPTISGTSLLLNYTNAGIIDNAMMNNLETVGDAKISTAQSKFGNSSMSFDGTGDYLTTTLTNLNYAFGSGDFTIEFWVYFNAFPSATWMVQLSQYVDTNNRVSIFFGNNATNENGLVFKVVTSSTVYKAVENDSASITMASLGYNTSTWYHVAITRSGSTIKGFINGTQKCTTTTSATFPTLSAPLLIGSFDTTPQFTHNGYIDDLRITKGYARYTSNFTPPTAALETQ